MQDCGSLSAPYRKKLGCTKIEQPGKARFFKLNQNNRYCDKRNKLQTTLFKPYTYFPIGIKT